ncbi:helix-turn-helix domain-containing protein [Plantactinospora sonchi]|uniref:Helix-turn-helix transcriptional regulator n=1 Tax=Plantactinospora sonchi TaxID=1544735 RepID=A0ABU7RQY0_9ACTN
MDSSALAAFVRSRREAVSPAMVGLPVNARRRTPGLRRAELATLAGVSVEYLTRIEQGRDRNPSPQVLGALADALGLSEEDRQLLRIVAKAAGGQIPCQAAGPEPPTRSLRPSLVALLDRLEPGPAYVLSRLGEIIAYTSGYERLAGPVGILDSRPANLVRFVLTDPRARSAYPEWGRVADDMVAYLKFGSRRADPYAAALVQELTATGGTPFTSRLGAPLAFPRRTGVRRLVHPEVGELSLAFESLDLPDSEDQRLFVLLPADEATATALDHLAGRQPGSLRVVGGRPRTGRTTPGRTATG